MEEIKAPKKERKFLKAMGDIALTLFRELVLGVGKKVINKIGNKRQGLVIAFLLVAGISYASIDSIPYPITGNKQRLGWQTSGNGLVYRGRSNDTITKPSSYVDKNVKAYLLLDSVRGTIFVWRQTYWDSILVSGAGGTFAQPIDSLFFDTTVPTNNVETAKMRWDSDLATVVLGLNDNVPNELGFKNFWLVKNQTGTTITKGSLVYANGTVGASGRITVAKFIANGSIDAKYLLGITAHDLTDGEDGYVISFGKIRQVNTDTFAAGAILYPSPTVAGVWTDVEPIAPNIDMPIGFCINSSSNNGTIAIRVASGYKLSELHDVAISSPVDKASLYYKGGLWRDTTAALLAGDTISLSNRINLKLNALDTASLSNRINLKLNATDTASLSDRINLKLNITDTSLLNLTSRFNTKLNLSDTSAMLLPYATKAYADTTGRFYARQDFTNVSSSTLNWTQSDTLIAGNSAVLQVYRNGQILLPIQYTVVDSNTITIASTAFKLGENYTVIFPRGGGAGTGGGSGSLTAIYGGTGIIVSPSPITTTGTVSADLSVLMELTDTSLLNLTSRFNTKQNTLVSGTNIKTVNSNSLLGSGNISVGTLVATDTVSLSNRINTKLNSTDTASLSSRINLKLNALDTASLSNRINLKLNALDTASLSNRINAKGTGTVTSVATGYGLTGGTITTSGTLVLDSAVVFSRIRDSIVDVAIGTDTIKILKQEYVPATTSVLTWTITPKFPIQLKQYILVFRNGQLLINDQYNLTDTNKITIVSNSFKLGANYTVVTVSGIGSVGTGTFPNPVYPDAGIALSTGSTWASSIPNNSTNWNTAYTDRLKWDGGATDLVPSTGRTSLGGTTIGQSMFTLTNPSSISFPRFNADNTVTALSAATFRSAIGAGTVTNVIAATTAGNPISITNNTTTPTIELLSATSGRNGYLTSTDWTTFNNKQTALNGTGFVKASGTTITYDNSTYLTTSSASTTYLAKTDTAAMLLPYFRDADTSLLNLTSRFLGKLNISDTAAMLSNYNTRINSKLNISDTLSMLTPYFRDADTSLLNLTSRFNTKLNVLDTTLMLSKYLRRADTSLLNLTSRFATKLNISDTAAMLSNYNTRINTKLNISDTTNMLLPYFRDSDTTQLNLTSRFAAKQNNISLTTTGTSGLATFDGTTLNIPNYTSSGGGTGTVTSVGLTAPSIFTVGGSPVTTSGTLALTYSGSALPLLNGGTGATTADAALTNFGASAMGKSLFGLTNSVTDKFIKVNSNNTITLLNADDTRTAIGAGIGTLTSVTASSPMASSGGTTPNISMTAAGVNVSGYVTHDGTQIFTGNKSFLGQTTFTGIAFFKDYTYQATRLAGLSSTDRFATVTLGSGLSLSGGVLSATSGGVTSVTASSPLSSTGGATPNITITDAGTGASGVVNTTTQSFAGNKTFTGTINVSSTGTFGGRVKTNWLERNYAYSTSSSFTISVNTTWQDINTSVLTTVTLPNAATYPGKELHIRQSGTGQIISLSSNIIPFTSPPSASPVTAILNPTTNRAVTLVSDGTNWIIMQRSEN